MRKLTSYSIYYAAYRRTHTHASYLFEAMCLQNESASSVVGYNTLIFRQTISYILFIGLVKYRKIFKSVFV